ncbi:MAG: ornithine carbamoyltransferase [Acidimicrobiia bacterium]|nr:ornithine carbamoyltransferase [Acidimicrobiia bacterium]
MTAHLLEITDLSAGEVRAVLDLAVRPIEALGRPLDGAGAALLFEKPSLRTRQSMEMAVVQLGGHPVYTRREEIGIDEREPLEDAVRILAGFHRLLAARVFDHTVLERMAAVSDVPVVNMLSDRAHPLQALADALTMEEAFGGLVGRTVAWVGDYNNVARSLGEVCALLGAHLRFACPVGFDADEAERERLDLLGAGSVVFTHRPAEAVGGADAVHADTWVSMGQEDEQASRRQAFEGFTVDEAMMAGTAPGAVFMHCLPAYRGIEVTAEVIDGPRSVVIRQGHNRLPAARAALAFLLGVSVPP